MPVGAEAIQQVLDNADCLYPAAAVERALDRLAQDVTARLATCYPVVLSVMTGGIVPTGHLLTRCRFPLELDYVHATRYRGGTRGGELHWLAQPTTPLEGRSVLVVDDILDEGLTLAAILDWCRARGAEQVCSAVLVKKLHGRGHAVEADFVGLTVEDRYVFGFGMDYKGYLRNLPGIYAVKE